MIYLRIILTLLIAIASATTTQEYFKLALKDATVTLPVSYIMFFNCSNRFKEKFNQVHHSYTYYCHHDLNSLIRLLKCISLHNFYCQCKKCPNAYIEIFSAKLAASKLTPAQTFNEFLLLNQQYYTEIANFQCPSEGNCKFVTYWMSYSLILPIFCNQTQSSRRTMLSPFQSIWHFATFEETKVDIENYVYFINAHILYARCTDRSFIFSARPLAITPTGNFLFRNHEKYSWENILSEIKKLSHAKIYLQLQNLFFDFGKFQSAGGIFNLIERNDIAFIPIVKENQPGEYSIGLIVSLRNYSMIKQCTRNEKDIAAFCIWNSFENLVQNLIMWSMESCLDVNYSMLEKILLLRIENHIGRIAKYRAELYAIIKS